MRAGILFALGAMASADTWSNWDTRQICHPHAHFSPNSTKYFQKIIKEASHVRIAGAGHSFSPIVLTEHTLITLENYQEVVAFEGDTITVQAGRPLYAVNDFLADHGRALPNLGAVAVQTAAGVTQTGTHGTGNTGCISDNIVGMDLILANGTLKSLSHPSDLFDAARVGMGVLGAVSTITFRHVPLWTMEQITFTLPLAKFEESRASLLNTYERMQWYLSGLPSDTTVTIVLRVNTTSEITSGCWSGKFAATPINPPPLGWPAWPEHTKSCVDHSYKVLGRDGKNNTHLFTEMEMMIPIEHDESALIDMLQVHAAMAPYHDATVPLFLGFRYVEADNIWLSPFYKRRTVVVSTIVYHSGDYEPEILRYHHAMQDALSKYSARPHTGKLNFFNSSHMAQVYPKFHDFNKLRAAIDPTGKFLNKYMRRLLSPTSIKSTTELETYNTSLFSLWNVCVISMVAILILMIKSSTVTKSGYNRL